MANYSAAQTAASVPVPNGVNPRLANVKETLWECEKALAEISARLGISDPPNAGAKSSETLGAGSSTGALTMELLASGGRLIDRARIIIGELG